VTNLSGQTLPVNLGDARWQMGLNNTTILFTSTNAGGSGTNGGSFSGTATNLTGNATNQVNAQIAALVPPPTAILTNNYANTFVQFNNGLEVSGDITLPDGGVFFTLGNFTGGSFSGNGWNLTNLNAASIVGSLITSAGYGNVPMVTNTPGGGYWTLYGPDGSRLLSSTNFTALATNAATASNGQALVKRGNFLALETVSGGGTTNVYFAGGTNINYRSVNGTNVFDYAPTNTYTDGQWYYQTLPNGNQIISNLSTSASMTIDTNLNVVTTGTHTFAYGGTNFMTYQAGTISNQPAFLMIVGTTTNAIILHP
jgi:hypothetical protein